MEMENVVKSASSDLVNLNVGGWKFTTTLSTLTGREPGSMLACMFSEQWRQKLDSTSAYFIDRDGRNFRYVLNYLRDGSDAYLPEDYGTIRELRREAEFYQLHGMLSNLTTDSSIKRGTLVRWRQETLNGYWRVMAKVLFENVTCLFEGFQPLGGYVCQNRSKSVFMCPHIWFGVLLAPKERDETEKTVQDLCLGCGEGCRMYVENKFAYDEDIASAVKCEMSGQRLMVTELVGSTCAVIKLKENYLHVSLSLITASGV